MSVKCPKNVLLDSTLISLSSYPYPFFSFFCMYVLVYTMQQVSRDAKTFFSQYVKIAAEVAAIQQLALCTTLGSIVVYTSVVYMRYIYIHTHCSWQHNRSFSEKSWKMRWTIATIQKDGNEWCEKGKHCTMGLKWWNIERNRIKNFEFDYIVPLLTICSYFHVSSGLWSQNIVYSTQTPKAKKWPCYPLFQENFVWFWTFIVNFRTLCNITFWTLNWWCRVLVPYKTSLPRDGFDWTLCDSCLVHKRVHLIRIDDNTHLISDGWQGEILPDSTCLPSIDPKQDVQY